MERKILVIAVIFSLSATGSFAQNKKHHPPAPPEAPTAEMVMLAPPPPPTPPTPPEAPEAPVAPEEAMPPVPPAPPIAPTPTIINGNGNEVFIRPVKGKSTVFIQRDGASHSIRLSTWNKNRKTFEKKFGQLPEIKPA